MAREPGMVHRGQLILDYVGALHAYVVSALLEPVVLLGSPVVETFPY